MFLNCCGGMFIFFLCKAILQNKRFANVTGGDFLTMKNGGEPEIQRWLNFTKKSETTRLARQAERKKKKLMKQKIWKT